MPLKNGQVLQDRYRIDALLGGMVQNETGVGQ